MLETKGRWEALNCGDAEIAPWFGGKACVDSARRAYGSKATRRKEEKNFNIDEMVGTNRGQTFHLASRGTDWDPIRSLWLGLAVQ